MQHYVDHIDRVPVFILVGLERYRQEHFAEGASVYPACQNLLLAAHALGYGGVLTGWHGAVERELRAELGIPDGVALSAASRSACRPGATGRCAASRSATILHDGVWGRQPDWLGEWDGD